MALFKILRGQSNKIGDVAFNDGYAYFTPDTGAFYIDAIVDGSDHRIQINSKETLGIFTSSTEPLDAITNDLWIDISDDGLGPLLKYKNNNGKWDTIGSVDVMSKTNPTGVGSIAMNPKDEAEVGKNSAIFGNMMSAIGENCFAAGGPLFGSVTSLSVNGVKNFKGIYMGAISATSDTFECMNDERLNEDFTVSCDTYLRDGTVICVRYLDDDGHIAYTGSRKIIFKEVDYDNEHTNVTKYTIDEPFGVDIPSGSEVYIVLSTAEVDGVASAIIGSGGTVCGSSSVGVGVNPVVDGNGSIAGGYNSTASGDNSVAVGYNSYVANDDAHAEGSATIANGWGAHSEGIPLGIDTKYLTSNVVCSGETYLVYYTNNRVNPGNIAFFNDNLRVGDFVLIRYIAPDEKGEDGNYYTTTRRIVSITEHTITLDLPIKTLNSSHIKIDAGAFILKAQNTQANSRGAHAEGQGTNANNTATHAEGSNTKASGYAAQIGRAHV